MSPIDLPLGILAAAFALTLMRIATGPSLADRVTAAELAFVVLLAGIGLLAARLHSTHALTVAVIAALLQFIATAALAALLLRAEPREHELP
ncbi:multisubunit sodium/proton antiporter MrpF subunit [Halopolyspora algeriensis]|uniref:Multisubunit sodium/proton antiporter MrpF subunit n=1 Tax=Halopolyspora algeriensis TaxID=1500506 RepID=A0A368VFS7_9ACTN|nr:monovalent cation/H+ antiporter complex subunit F [Halopolyspora algeriensis]RCW39130.1 multisubunit sodium/proton antiporter MrpF subunit [Halopolyspora algeriensis]TQM56573.1 multisubunit sodium/proton antiporter MrpF subunit [Halopolyspora algeriensis]